MGPMQKEDTNSYWEEQTFKQKTLEDIRNTNKSLYQFDMSEMEYKPFADHFLDVMKNEGVEAAEKEKWRYMNALQYSRMYGYDFDYALENVDALNAANMNRPSVQPPDEDYRGICERLGDSWVIGMNSQKRNELGMQLKELEEYKKFASTHDMSKLLVDATRMTPELHRQLPDITYNGDIDKQIQDCLAAIQAIDEENQLLSISQNQSVAMEAITGAIQSLPYTIDVALKGTFDAASMGAPVLAPLAFINAGKYAVQGSNYIDLRQKGISPEIASKVSSIESGIQGTIEVALDQTIGAVFKVAGKGNVTNAVSDAINKATGGKAGGRLVRNWLVNYFVGLASEGLEEGLQQITENVATRKAIDLEKAKREQELEEAVSIMAIDATDEARQKFMEQYPELAEKPGVFDDFYDQVKGGFLTAIVLGLPGSVVSAKASTKEYLDVKDKAESIASVEEFKKEVKDSPVFAELNEKEKNTVITQVWEEAQQRVRDATEADVAESKDLASQAEGVATDEEGNRIVKSAEFREESGELHIEKDQSYAEVTEGKEKGRYLLGDPTRLHSLEENGNRYGYIDYSVKGNKVTVENFRMSPGREALAPEFYREFAKNFIGKDIQWNPKQKTNLDLKKQLIESNPSGNGLNYYRNENDIQDVKTFNRISKDLSKALKDKKQLTAGTALAMSVLKKIAKDNNMTVDETIDAVFADGKILTDVIPEEFKNQDPKEGLKLGSTQRITEFFTTENFKKINKALVYVSEHGDLNTMAHELMHAIEPWLSDEDLKTIKTTLGEKDWHEKLADIWGDYLESGKSPLKGLEKVLKAIKEFFKSFIENYQRGFQGKLQLSPELEKIFENLLSEADETVEKQSEIAASNTVNQNKAADAQNAATETQNTTEDTQNITTETQNKYYGTENSGTIIVTTAEQLGYKLNEKEDDTIINMIGDLLDYTSHHALEVLIPADVIAQFYVEEFNKGNFAHNLHNYIGSETASEYLKLINAIHRRCRDWIITSKQTTVEEKAEAVQEEASTERKYKIPDDEFFQIISLSTFDQMTDEDFKKMALESYNQAVYMYDSVFAKTQDAKIANSMTKQLTGWQKDKDGEWKYETNDSLTHINEEAIKPLLNMTEKELIDKNYHPALSQIYDAPELFAFYPALKPITVNFTKRGDANFRAVFGQKGITINLANIPGMRGPLGLKGALCYAIQQAIALYENYHTDKNANIVRDYDLSQNLNYLDPAAEKFAEEARKAANRVDMSRAERNSTLFQIIGEKGALNLDRVRAVHELQDAMFIAKEMEDSGKDAKTIRLATGWEKGVDGKWRYETADDIQLDTFGMAQLRRENPDYRRMDDLEQKWFDEEISEEEEKELNKLYDTVERPDANIFHEKVINNQATLKDVIKNDELLEAYPQLADVKLYFGKIEGDYNTKGMYSPEENAIILFHTKPESLTWSKSRQTITVLTHEIQHVIQAIEGFAAGGNPEQFDVNTVSRAKIEAQIDKIKKERSELIFSIPSEEFIQLDKKLTETSMTDEEYKNARYDIYKKYEVGPKIITLSEEIESLLDRISEIDENALDGQVELEDGRLYEDSFAAYRSLAGEVEARNAQSRIGMSADERLNTLLEDSEDIDRDQQIIMYQTLAAEAAVDAAAQERAVREEYENTENWMKAPNGKKTNLTEKQWVQVRTDNFKKWFGDWENDPQNASKVVDENGEPMIMYHGARIGGFKKFEGNKMYFTSSLNAARSYTGEIKYLSYYEGHENPAPEIIASYIKSSKPLVKDYADYEWDVIPGASPDEVSEQARAEGYDGVILNNIQDFGEFATKDDTPFTEVIVFDSSQIKSATDNNGEFAADNPSILFQTDLQKEDIETLINGIEHTEQRNEYIKRYYTDKKNDYSVQSFTSSDGLITANLEIYNKRKQKQEDIDTALVFANKGIDVTLLPEGEVKGERNPDALFNHSTLAEFKQVTTNNTNTIATEIKKAANKLNSEIVSVLLLDKAKEVNLEDVIKLVNYKTKGGVIYGNIDEVLFIKDGKIRSVNKKTTGPAIAGTRRTSNLQPTDDIVKLELDKEYEKAVTSGNIDKAKEMLLKKATENGYVKQSYFGDGSWAAPTAGVEKNQFTDLEALQQYVDDYGDEVNIYGIINGVQAHHEDYYFNPTRAGFTDQAAVDTSQVYRRLRYDKAGPDTKITVYRAIPNDIHGKKLLAGDWIALSKKYCEEHGKNRYGENNYHVIEQEVPISNIWQGSEDMREFGFDDGNGEKDVEKNVPNNRKLLDITYDKAGNLIPLSERFNQDIPSILFQTAYHGSGADFEKFDTDTYALSGEGSMSFGYGAYVTGDRKIALDYAERQGNPIGYRIKALTEIIKEEEELLKENLSERVRYVKEKDLKTYKAELEKLKEQQPSEDEIRGKRKVYTVEIPDDGFIKWDENVKPELVEQIVKEYPYMYGLQNLLNNYNKWKDNPNATYLYGSNIYRAISKELGSDKAATHFLYNLGFKGIDYPAGSIHGNGNGARNYVVFSDDDLNIVDKTRFQTAYHGSAADFDKFDLNYGLSGEGSMSFGYGVYVTNDQSIAKDYAERQVNDKYFTSMANDMLKNIESGYRTFEEEKQNAIDWYSKWTKYALENPSRAKELKAKYDFALSLTSLEDLKAASNPEGKRQLYTTAIPDGEYILWDEEVPKEYIERVKKTLFDILVKGDYSGAEKELTQEFNDVFTDDLTGEVLYNNVIAYTGSQKEASDVMYKAGFVGIDYPAGTNFGPETDARNYVIFNADDIEITDHTRYQEIEPELAQFFQSEAELLSDAAMYDSWEEFKNAYVMDFDPVALEDPEYHSQVPSDADDAWYKKVWERAHQIADQNEYNDEYVQDVREEDIAHEDERDEEWFKFIQEDGNLDDFLRAIDYESSYDQEIDEAQPMDQEDLDELQRRADLRERYNKEIRHGTWRDAAWKARQTKPGEKVPITDRQRKQLITMMKNSKRDYRDLYAAFMNDPSWEVLETSAEKIVRTKIASPDSDFANITEEQKKEIIADIEAMTPEKRREVVAGLDFDRLKKELKNGTLEMNLENLEIFIKGYEDQIQLLNNKIDAMKRQHDANAELAVKQYAQLEKLMAEREEKIAAKTLAENIREIKVRLIKNINKKVNWKTIDYAYGKKIIAIQALFQPALRKFVNRFLNTEVYLRDAYSRYQTEYEYRARMNMLAQRSRGNAIKKVVNLLKNKTFEKWTKDEMEFVAKYLPKTNWVKELDLDRIEKDRDASLQLDLQTEENQALLAVTLPEDYRALLTSKDVQNWTLEQMEGLANIVDELRVLGREELRIKNEARLEEAEKKRTMIEREIRSSGVEIHTEDPDWLKEKKMKDIENFNKNRLPDILGLNSAAKGTLENANDKQRGIFKRIINGYGDANIRRVSRILDNDKEGINTTLLFYREDECFNAEQKAITSRTKKITDAMNNLGITIEELYSPVEIEFYGGRKEYITYTDTNNNQHKLTMDEVLYIIAAADDERSRLAVACGNLVTAEEKDSYKQQGEKGEETCFAVGTARMDDIIKQAATINPKWIKFLATIQEDYAQQYERMNKVSIEEFNQPVARVKNYVPLNRLESNGDTNVNRVKEDLLGSSAVGGANWVDKGMTKSRVDISPTNQKPVVMGLYSTWADSLNRTEHFLNYASYVRELNRVYKSRDSQLLRNHIENRYSKDMLTYIDEYIQELANPDVSSAQNQLDRIARALRGKTASAYLAWKTSSVIKQFCTSPWPYMRFTSPVKYLASMFDFIRHPGQMSDLIKSKSAYMNSRRFDPIADLIDEQQKKATNKVSSALAGFENMGMQGLEMVDWVCVAPGWLAVYKDEFARLSSDKEQKKLIEQKKKELEKYADVEGWDWIDAEAQKAALTEGEIERLAVRKADDITRQCQPSNRLTDLSPIFKQRGPGSEIGRIFLQFTTSLNVIWQNIRYDIPSDIRHGEYKRALMTIAGYALAGITMGLVTEGLTDDDDDENADAKQIAYYGSTQFTDSIPVIGSVVTAAVKQLITGKKNYSQGVSDIFPQLTKISKGLASASEGKWTNACSNFAYALALSLGLPVSGAKELGEAAGLTDDEEGLDFKPEAFIGRR